MIYNQNYNITNLLNVIPQEVPFVRLVIKHLVENPKTGYVIFQVVQEPSEKIPIANARVTLSKYLGENRYISKVLITDKNGETPLIPLPTPESLSPEKCKEYATYNALIEASNFITQEVIDFKVFSDMSKLEQVALVPGTNVEVRQIYIEEPPHL